MKIMIADDDREAMLTRALSTELYHPLRFKPLRGVTAVAITQSGLVSVPSRCLTLQARYDPEMGKAYVGNKHYISRPLPTGKKRTRWKMAKQSKRRNR